MTKEERRFDLSGKLLKMGEALISEGRDSMDGCVMQTGSTLLLLSDIISSEEDMFVFGELMSMFTAKKILDEMDKEKKSKINDGLISSLIETLKNVGNIIPSKEAVKEAPKETTKEAPKKVRKPRKKKTDTDEPTLGS